MLDPMTTLQQAIQSFRAGVDTLSNMLSEHMTHDARALLVRLIETVDTTQTAFLEAQKQHISLAEHCLELKNEATRLKKALDRVQAYRLYEPKPGVYVYAAKDSLNPPDPSKWLCCHCEDKGVSAPLALENGAWRCPYCSLRLE